MEKTDHCPAIAPIALQRYIGQCNALGDAPGRREPSAMNHHGQKVLIYV